jgi:hypothetical protein
MIREAARATRGPARPQLGGIGESIEGLERLASSLGSVVGRELVLVRLPSGKAAIVEIDAGSTQLRHVLVEGVSERVARKIWGQVREGLLPRVLAVPRVPPLRGRALDFPEEDDRKRIALGLLAVTGGGLTARQLFEMRGVDKDRLALWQGQGLVQPEQLVAAPVKLAMTPRARPLYVEWRGGQYAPRYFLTERGRAEWDRLEQAVRKDRRPA